MSAPRETRSTCPYCGVGCGVIIESVGTHITHVRGDPEHPANFGRLCTKGSTLHLTASAALAQQTRLLTPMQRMHRGAAPQPLSWDAALDMAANRFARTILQHGPEAIGFYVSGQLLTEDYYVFNKLVKGLIGSNNIDTNSRLCMSSAVAGYKQSLGVDAPPACYDDLALAQTLFIAGSNMAYAHPILFRRIEEAKTRNPNLQIVVCDPRRTDTAAVADLHLAIQPGTDVMLFHGMLHILLWENWVDVDYIAAHTSGFEALKDLVRDYTPFSVAQVCGITKEALLQATRLFAGITGNGAARTPTLSLYCQGLNQSSSGTAKNTALINLHLATGQIGKPGAGPFSLTGQPNAMGGREVGGLATALSAHRDLGNPDHRAEVAALWGVPSVPAKPGKTAVEMFEAAADGEIKALWIACTNPAHSMPNQSSVRRALERAEFIVVQEAFATTATCAYADLLLPATTWGEKEGTVTNSERRISRVRAAVPPPASPASPHNGPRHDWQIAVEFAQRLEKVLPSRSISPTSGASLFAYSTPEAIWNEHRASTQGRDLDITGMTYAMLEAAPQQWPLPAGQTQGTARLYENGIFPTPDGRARFIATAYKGVAEPREARYPFALSTGRLRDQWHGMSRTGQLGRLFGHEPEPLLHMHPRDMARQQLRDRDLAYVTSKRGAIVLPVQSSPEPGPGQVFLAMHWGEESLSGQSSTGQRLAGVNTLTSSAYCPDSKQPEFKHAAVKVLKADMPWTLLAMAWLPENQAFTARNRLQPLMQQFAFASCVPFAAATGAQERCGILLRAAHHDTPTEDVLLAIEATLQLLNSNVLRYADKKRGQRRTILLAEGENATTLDAFLLAGDTSAQTWISTLLLESLPAHHYGRALLMPGAKPPVPVVSRGKVVCTCFGVTDTAITQHLNQCSGSPAQRLESLQSTLKCGTNCGSCLPQVRGMVQ